MISDFGPTSTPQSIPAPETLTLDMPGLIDTSVAVELNRIQIAKSASSSSLLEPIGHLAVTQFFD